MRLQNEQSKENILTRLRRIEGQIRGIQKMVSDERDCREILQQITAVKSAIQSMNSLFLKEYVTDCIYNLSNQTDASDREIIIDDLVNLMGKTS